MAASGASRALPDVPAMAETLPGFVSIAWFGVVAPPKTSPAIADKLAAAIAEALKLPGRARSGSPTCRRSRSAARRREMAAFMKQETER